MTSNMKYIRQLPSPEELKEAFGDQIFIPEEPEFVNAKGFLRKICADDGIDIETTQTEEG